MRQRLIGGIFVILAGLILLARQLGLWSGQINIASLAILLVGLWLFANGFGRRSFLLGLAGAWLAALGGTQLLPGLSTESWLFRLILPGFLVGLGLDLLFRPRRPRSRSHARGVVGDQRIGQEPWQVNGDLKIEHGVGDLKVDLTTAVISPGSHEITVKQGMGSAIIIVPTDVSVEVEGRVKMGELILFGEQREGAGAHLKAGWSLPESPVQLRIKAKMGTGNLRVIAAEPRRPEGWQ